VRGCLQRDGHQLEQLPVGVAAVQRRA
jgi:hypothetical protein